MATATIARIDQLEKTARTITRQIDRTEFFADMIDWNSMTVTDCYQISMWEEHLAETLFHVYSEIEFRQEQLCMTAH